MNNEPKLGPRLAAAAQMAEGFRSVADIGSDHCLLPIRLVLDGCRRVQASDVNEGPVMRGRGNVARFGLCSRISVVLRNGLDGIEEFAPECIVICGMGGELIADIIAASAYPSESRCRLVLQPMTMQYELRRYLCDSGYRIDEERVVFDDGKYYQLIAAGYDGTSRSMYEYEYLLGRQNLERAAGSLSETDRGWLERIRAAAGRRIAGRSQASDCDAIAQQRDIELVGVIDKLLEMN